ncbi:MAG: hypothetical protein ACYTE3_26565, partial [Planctomycetota bacterium]
SGRQSTERDDADHLSAAAASTAEGLKIARDCGFGLYHIDLLLERARLHLLRGHPAAALEDIELALDTGIAANEETGQPELLAANDEACGYAWPIPAGLQLRAEAQLLQAAQEVVSVGWAVPTDGSLNPINVDAVCTAHPTIGQLIDEARTNLNTAMDRWQPLHDPEPERPDQNFKHDGKEYNYRAAHTHQTLVQLDGGILTRYPLERIDKPESKRPETRMTKTPAKVFFSYAHEDESYKDKLVKHLSILQRQSVIEVWHDRKIVAGDEWKGEIDGRNRRQPGAGRCHIVAH